ncbi:MAG: hypothetical protein WC683_09735 [bacterium]
MKTPSWDEYIELGEKPKAGTPIRCLNCGKVFKLPPQTGIKKYCGDTCKDQYRTKQKKRPLFDVTCPICGKKWQAPNRRFKLCSDECRRENARRHNARKNQNRPELTPDEVIKQRDLIAYERQVREGTGRTAILADLLADAVKRVNEKDIKPQPVKRRSKRDKETMVLLRSDWHPGIITPSYNLDVFHRRVEMLTEKVILFRDIISETIPIEKLVIIDLGDMISGQDIYPGQAWKSEKHVLEQIYHEASPAVIRQNLTFLEYFPLVEEHSIPGNHGRTGKYAPLEVNFDNVLAQDIYRRFEFVKRFGMYIEWDWWKYVDIYGWRFLALHGNQLRGYLNIPFYNIVTKGMRWQGSMPGGPWHCLVHGHWHVPFIMPWNNFRIVSNGTLVSDDEFALRELGMSSTPAQQFFMVHPDHIKTLGTEIELLEEAA